MTTPLALTIRIARWRLPRSPRHRAVWCTARIAWWTVASVVAGLGLLAALFTLSGGALMAIVPCSAVVGCVASCTVAWSPLTGPHDPAARGPGRRTIATTTAAVVAAGIAATGLVSLTGPSGLALLAALAATCPPVQRRFHKSIPTVPSRRSSARRAKRRERLSVGPAVVSLPTSASPGQMSTEQLCLSWRRSFTALQQARTVTERAAATAVRADHLDELERRDPAGFAAWMANSPRPASDPARYVNVLLAQPTTAASDEGHRATGLNPPTAAEEAVTDGNDASPPMPDEG